MPSEHHIIIKPIHTAIISLGFIIAVVTLTAYIISMRKDIDYARTDINNLSSKVEYLSTLMRDHINQKVSLK